MIQMLKTIEWKILGRAVRMTATLFGLIAIAAWFAQPWPWWMVAASATAILAAAACLYLICLGVERRRRIREFKRDHSRIQRKLRRKYDGQSWPRMIAMPELRGLYQRRFVRIDENGDEVYAYDPVN